MKKQTKTDEATTDVLGKARDVFRVMTQEERAELLKEFHDLCVNKKDDIPGTP